MPEIKQEDYSLSLYGIFGTVLLHPEHRFILLNLDVPPEFEPLKSLLIKAESTSYQLLSERIENLGYDINLFLDNAKSPKQLSDLVEDYNKKRETERFKNSLKQLIETTSVDNLNESKSKLLDVIASLGNQNNVEAIDEIFSSFVLEMSKLRETGGLQLPLFDEQISGLLGGEMIVVAARPSVGKTALLLTIAERFAERGIPVGFVSVEMPETALLARMAARFIPNEHKRYNLYSGYSEMDEDTFRNIMLKAQKYLSELPIYFGKIRNNHIENIENALHALVYNHQVKVLFVDYLQLITAKGHSRVEEVGKISNTLKFFAKTTGTILITASQLNRESEKRENKRPTMAELRESGAIEQDADIILLVWRPNKDKPLDEINPSKYIEAREYTEVIIAKQRNGATGEAYLWFDMPNQYFYTLQEWLQKQQ